MSLDMVLYPFVASLTLDASSGNVVGGATGSVFAKADTTFTTPLAAVDASGNPVTLTSNANGVLPSFYVDGHTSVNWVSGSWVFPLVTSEPVEGPEGPAGVSVNGATATGDDLVFSLSNGATTPPVKLPTAPGGSDAGVASYITTPGTETATALSATIAEQAPSFGSKLFHAAQRRAWVSPEDLPVMSVPPTITTGTANLDGTLTKMYRYDTNPEVFRVCGGEPFNWNNSGYFRTRVVTLPTGTGNADPTHNAYAWFYEFETASAKVLLHMLGQTGATGVTFEVDGQKVSSTSTPYPATTGNAFFLLTFPTAATRRIRVWLDLAGGFMRAYVGPNDFIRRSQNFPIRFGVLGDSIAASTGATTRPDGGFASLLGKLMGWDDVWQIALGGTGFVTPDPTYSSTFGDSSRVADITAAAPEAILVSATPNDNGKTASSITTAALSALQAYRTAAPNALVIVAGLIPPSGGVTAQTTANENAVKAAYDQWGDGNSMWIPVSTDPAGAWAVSLMDSVHPNAAGHVVMARKFAGAIRPKLK